MKDKNLIEKIKVEIQRKFIGIFRDENTFSHLKRHIKDDKTLVTEIDIYISKLVKDLMANHYNYSDLNFFSEEDWESLKYPTIILDPIDGTKELSRGIAECVACLAVLRTPSLSSLENEAWIYNPFSGFELGTHAKFQRPLSQFEGPLYGLVSRTEWEKSLFDDCLSSKDIVLTPRGSIAFKLSLLASSACDFVIARRDKHIWDIAGGTLLLAERGYSFYEKGIKVENLDKQVFSAPLCWCREENKDKILKHFV